MAVTQAESRIEAARNATALIAAFAASGSALNEAESSLYTVALEVLRLQFVEVLNECRTKAEE